MNKKFFISHIQNCTIAKLADTRKLLKPCRTRRTVGKINLQQQNIGGLNTNVIANIRVVHTGLRMQPFS